MEKYLRTIEKFIPKAVYKFFQPAYHYLITLAGAMYYGFPSKQITVVGITGTKGKSSTVEITNAILEEAGLKTAMSNSIRFKIGNDSRPNLYKMSMPGRFFMQKFLADAVKAGCTHAVLEITSEGYLQFRNKWIDLDVAVFTNLSPEHIERHGSYENYRQAKVDIIKAIETSSKKNRAIVINCDDAEKDYFLGIKADKVIEYSLSQMSSFHEDEDGVKFMYKRELFTSPLMGTMNGYNILASIKIAEHLGVSLSEIRKALQKFEKIPGRAERIVVGKKQNFEVVVDYAHTAESLKAVYEAFDHARKRICVLGNTGGGRDKWKRPVMAQVAEDFCDHVILTNEDPYDEDPMAIINDMKKAIEKKPLDIILHRREAISHALSLAKEGDAVIITGKGTDPYIMGPNGEKTPWSDATVVKEELRKLQV